MHAKAISRIQSHYGGNIRAHVGDLESMKKSIGAFGIIGIGTIVNVIIFVPL